MKHVGLYVVNFIATYISFTVPLQMYGAILPLGNGLGFLESAALFAFNNMLYAAAYVKCALGGRFKMQSGTRQKYVWHT